MWKIDSRRLRGFNGAGPFFPVESGAEPKDSGAETESPFPIHWACWHILKQQYALLAPKAPLQPNLDNLAELFMSQARYLDNGLVPRWCDHNGLEQFWRRGDIT